LKKLKSWGPFWRYQLNSTANLANLAHFGGKCAELAVLCSWCSSKMAPRILIFFNCHEWQLIIWELSPPPSPPFFGHNNSFLGGVGEQLTNFISFNRKCHYRGVDWPALFVKGREISEGIFNLVASSKKMNLLTVPKLFNLNITLSI
jgi:hypothetical protein